MAEVCSCFGILPVEVVFMIFDYLGLREKKKSRLVCHRWRSLLDNQRSIAFRPKLVNQSGVKYFMNSYRTMDLVIMRNVKLGIVAKCDQFPIIKHGELGWRNSEESIVRFLRDGCEQMESLKIAKFSLERISRGRLCKITPELKCYCLTRLNLQVVMSRYKQVRARKHLWNMISFLTLAKIPQLRDFEFNFDFQFGFTKKRQIRFQILLLRFYNFLANHSKYLQILKGFIETASRRKLEVPEIPTNLKTAIVYHLRLYSCSLKFWGVRNPHTLAFPALFGSNLRNLELETSKGIHNRFVDHDTTLDDIPLNGNLTQVFKDNSKTLRYVFLDLRVVDSSWFKNCSSLEYLILYAREQLPTQEILPQMKLEFLRLYSYGKPNPFPPEILQLYRQNKRTLEYLSISFNDISNLIRTPLRLNEFIALKHLVLNMLPMEFIAANTGTEFPHLIEFKTYIDAQNSEAAPRWIAMSMKNLRTISLYGPHVRLRHIQTLLSIPKLINITFWTGDLELEYQVKKYCENTPGVNLQNKTNRNDLNLQKRIAIRVERTIFNAKKLEN